MNNYILTWSRLIEISPLSLLISSNLLPGFSGVYRLSYKSSDGNIYVFYVGQAENIDERIRSHFSQTETNMCIRKMLSSYACYVRYARVTDPDVRDGAEKFLFKHYSPSCNSIEPFGTDILINIENT